MDGARQSPGRPAGQVSRSRIGNIRMTLHSDFLRDSARRDASELVDDLLTQALLERRYGKIKVKLQDGVPSYVREERVHKISPKPDGDQAA